MEVHAPSGTDESRAYRARLFAILGVIGGLSAGQSLYALGIGDRFLLKDGIDWAYDVILWAVALAVFGRGAALEKLAAFGVAVVMLVAAGHTAYDLWDKIATGRRPELWVAGWSAITAIALAFFVLALMWRFRASDHPLIMATWLTSRNDVISTTAFALVGFVARTSSSQIPEILLDLFVIALSLQAAGAIAVALRQKPGIAAPGDGQAGGDAASR